MGQLCEDKAIIPHGASWNCGITKVSSCTQMSRLIRPSPVLLASSCVSPSLPQGRSCTERLISSYQTYSSSPSVTKWIAVMNAHSEQLFSPASFSRDIFPWADTPQKWRSCPHISFPNESSPYVHWPAWGSALRFDCTKHGLQFSMHMC